MSRETVLSLLKKATTFFEEKGVSEAKRSAEHLLAYALGKKRIQLYLRFDQPVGDAELELFRTYVRRRLADEPVQYIVGNTEFYGMEFELTPDVLIPRPETEHLVEAVVDWARAQEGLTAPTLLDIGTGCGCIAIAVAAQLHECTCIALDISEAALAVAKRNAERHGVSDRIQFLQHDMLSNRQDYATEYDIVVSNPPYVTHEDFDGLQPEILVHEPRYAITDESDGLTFYKRIAKDVGTLLAKQGLLAVEIGYGQLDAIRSIFDTAGIKVTNVIKDYSGIDRVVLGKIYHSAATAQS